MSSSRNSNPWALQHAGATPSETVAMWNEKLYTHWAGMRVVEAAKGQCVLELTVGEQHRGGAGTDGINGAIQAYMHDLAQGVAVRTTWDSAHRGMATISINIQYLRVLNAQKLLVGKARLVERGGTVAYAESELLDDAGVVCSRATGQFRLFRC